MIAHELPLIGEVYSVGRDRRGRVLWRESVRNGITIPGLTDLLSAGFANGTQRTAWHFGLIDGSGFSEVSPTDTAASHSGWAEEEDYSGNRKQWSLTVNGGIASTNAAALFAFTASASVRGVFLATASTKGSTSGVLWSTALFSSVRAMLSGQSLSVSYRIRGSGGAG